MYIIGLACLALCGIACFYKIRDLYGPQHNEEEASSISEEYQPKGNIRPIEELFGEQKPKVAAKLIQNPSKSEEESKKSEPSELKSGESESTKSELAKSAKSLKTEPAKPLQKATPNPPKSPVANSPEVSASKPSEIKTSVPPKSESEKATKIEPVESREISVPKPLEPPKPTSPKLEVTKSSEGEPIFSPKIEPTKPSETATPTSPHITSTEPSETESTEPELEEPSGSWSKSLFGLPTSKPSKINPTKPSETGTAKQIASSEEPKSGLESVTKLKTLLKNYSSLIPKEITHVPVPNNDIKDLIKKYENYSEKTKSVNIVGTYRGTKDTAVEREDFHKFLECFETTQCVVISYITYPGKYIEQIEAEGKEKLVNESMKNNLEKASVLILNQLADVVIFDIMVNFKFSQLDTIVITRCAIKNLKFLEMQKFEKLSSITISNALSLVDISLDTITTPISELNITGAPKAVSDTNAEKILAILRKSTKIASLDWGIFKKLFEKFKKDPTIAKTSLQEVTIKNVEYSEAKNPSADLEQYKNMFENKLKRFTITVSPARGKDKDEEKQKVEAWCSRLNMIPENERKTTLFDTPDGFTYEESSLS